MMECQTEFKPNYHAQLTVSKFQHANKQTGRQQANILTPYSPLCTCTLFSSNSKCYFHLSSFNVYVCHISIIILCLHSLALCEQLSVYEDRRQLLKL